MKNLEVSLLHSNNPTSVELVVRNLSMQCYKVSSTHLMLEGKIMQDNFVVTDKHSNEVQSYQGILAKLIPSYLELNAGQELHSAPIDLTQDYGLEHGHEYDVYYNAMLVYMPCDKSVDYEMESVSSNHIDIHYNLS